jgi:hypothetical protein
MPVVTGLYALLIPMAVFAIFGSSRYLVVGADSATAAILGAALAGLAAAGSPQYVRLAGLSSSAGGGEDCCRATRGCAVQDVEDVGEQRGVRRLVPGRRLQQPGRAGHRERRDQPVRLSEAERMSGGVVAARSAPLPLRSRWPGCSRRAATSCRSQEHAGAHGSRRTSVPARSN